MRELRLYMDSARQKRPEGLPDMQKHQMEEKMSRALSPEHLARIKAGRKANADKFDKQVISVDENWQIRRADQWNWEIRQKVSEKWVFKGYYGKLNSALMALPAHMIGEQAKDSLEHCLICLKDIKYSILAALPNASKLSEQEKQP